MKKLSIFLIILFPFSLSNARNYSLVERKLKYEIVLNPNIKTSSSNCAVDKEQSLFISREMLKGIDGSLLKNDYLISVSDEILCNPAGDTFAVKIFDFKNLLKDKDLSGFFNNKIFVTRYFGGYKMYMKFIYFIDQDNLCVIYSYIGHKVISDSTEVSFKNFLEEESKNRLSP